MKKATLKKLLEWALTIGLVALLVVVVYHRFFGPGKQPQAQVWNPLPGVATVEVADNRETITRGLMGRDSLPRDHGMYFLYEGAEQVHKFHMKNTRIPLSIAFIRADGVIATIKDMTPFDETPVSSEVAVKDALEMNQGWFAENDVRVGDRAKLEEDDGTVTFSRRSR